MKKKKITKHKHQFVVEEIFEHLFYPNSSKSKCVKCGLKRITEPWGSYFSK